MNMLGSHPCCTVTLGGAPSADCHVPCVYDYALAWDVTSARYHASCVGNITLWLG